MKKQNCFKTWVGIFPGEFSGGGGGGGEFDGWEFSRGNFPDTTWNI